MILKETILKQIYLTSNDIAKEFDSLYSKEIEWFAEEMALSYQILLNIMNREDQSKISDADFQSALLFWTALNTYLAAIELFRRGYNKEPQMLIRNMIETFSAAYDLHVNPKKLDNLKSKSKKFDSKKSIKIVKKINPVIAQMWGNLSSFYSHVSLLHTVPHKTTPFCVGGLFDLKDQEMTVCSIISPLTLVLDIFGSVLELTFIKEVEEPRFWEKVSDKEYLYKQPQKNKNNGKRLLEKMKNILNNINK